MKFWPSSNSVEAKGNAAPPVKTASLLVLLGLFSAALVFGVEYRLRSEAATLAPIEVAMEQQDETDSLEQSGIEDDLSAEGKTQDFAGDSAEVLLSNGQLAAKEQLLIPELFGAALKLSKSDQYEKSENLYRKILEIRPNHQMALINIGIGQKKQGHCVSAIQTFNEALTIASSSRKGKIHALIGSCLMDQQQYQAAIEHFQLSIEFRPTHSLTWRRLAKAMAGAKTDYDQVVDTFDRAIAMDDKDVAIHLAKAWYHYESLDFRAAIKGLSSKALPKLSRKQDMEARYQLLSLLYIELGKFSKAKKYTKKWLKLDENNPYAKSVYYLSARKYKSALKHNNGVSDQAEYLRALTYRHINSEKAIDLLLALSEMKELGYLARFQLVSMELKQQGRGLNRGGRSSNSVDAKIKVLGLAERLQKEPLYAPPVWVAAAKLALILDKPVSAKYYSDALISRDASKKSYRLLDAKVEARYGSAEASFTKLSSMLNDYPNSKDVKRVTAAVLSQLGRVEPAIELMQKVVAKSPREVDMIVLAKLFQEKGQLQEANNTLSDLLETESGHIEGRYLLAQNLCNLGQFDACQYHAQLVLKLDKNHLGAIGLYDLFNITDNKPSTRSGSLNHG